MISLGEINSKAEHFNLPSDTIEKDYVIGWILNCVAQSSLKRDLIFYGGTAIKKAYFEDHRFSEDIDFFSKKVFPTEKILENIAQSFKYAKGKVNLSLGIPPNGIVQGKERVEFQVNYVGYDEIIGSPKEVRIDIVMGLEPYGETREKKMIGTYSDLKTSGSALFVQTLNTILASKFGMLMDITRKEPRDIFDIWFLLNRSGQFNFSTKKIEKFFKEKYGISLNWDILRSHLYGASYRDRWIIRLKKQIADLPPFELVLKEIEDKIRIHFKSH